MKLHMKYISLTLFFILFTYLLQAAGPPPPITGSNPGCWPPGALCVPIDGGISLLIAAGAIYGGRKLYNFSKTEE